MKYNSENELTKSELIIGALISFIVFFGIIIIGVIFLLYAMSLFGVGI